jgi:xylitol oxidase
MTIIRNWADNHTFKATNVHRPATVDDARRVIAAASHIHAVGAAHSFSAVADSAGDLIDLSQIDPRFVIDQQQRTVTAGAGTTWGDLAVWLQNRGWALHNMASLPHVTLAGAIATGTHGSGDGLGNLSTAAAGLELVTATGDLMTTRRRDAGFEGMAVGLGALGVITRVTLDIQPTFDMRQDAFEGLTWNTVLADLEGVMSAGYSVSLMTGWSGPLVSRLWIKTRLLGGAPTGVSADHLGARPAAHPSANATPDAPGQLNPFGGVPGPWSERLPHFRRDADPGIPVHLQSEYIVPRVRATEAMQALRAIGDRIDPHLLTTEIRSMAGDTLWLSPAFGHDSIGIHFSWKRDIDAVAVLTREIEAMLLPLGARAHWGKIMHTPATQLGQIYPRLHEFRALARTLDPDGKFRNDFLNAHVFA